MEYKLMGVPVRVGIHYLSNRRYIIRQGDYEGDAYTFRGAEEKIMHLIEKKLGESYASDTAAYKGDLPPSVTKASHDLDSYARLRESEFRISVPAEVYGGRVETLATIRLLGDKEEK